MKLNPETAKVGEGATICCYTDSHAYIIKKTATTITIQRDKATLVTTPEFVIGGFIAHCTNNNSMESTYEADLEGRIEVARWSKKKQKYVTNGLVVIAGRHEHYDYNF